MGAIVTGMFVSGGLHDQWRTTTNRAVTRFPESAAVTDANCTVMLTRSRIPAARVTRLNEDAMRPDGTFVLYWMTSARRLRSNFGLDRAIEWSRELQRPLVILEALRSEYPWASDRLHAFVVGGMVEHARELAGSPVTYYPYLEPEAGHGSGLLAALATQANVIVTDSFPCFFLPAMTHAAAARVGVLLEAVDSNGLLPLAAAPKTFHRAVDFRRFLQRVLPDHLGARPQPDPVRESGIPGGDVVPREILERWPPAPVDSVDVGDLIRDLPIDHSVSPVDVAPGTEAGLGRVESFLDAGLGDYGGARRDPARGGTSGISAHLHFGHLSPHQVLDEIARRFSWSPDQVGGGRSGARLGWWGLPEAVETFLDELVTWRELSYVFCHREADYASFTSLPAWAQQTLEDHVTDPRDHVYSLGELEAAATHDEIWNATQRQLARDGVIHSYLRMLWAKRVLEWTRHPDEARAFLIELNNRYAIDGRNPNSYSGIMWTLGRFDRAWGPERPIYGKVRYMSSENTRRKMSLDPYLERYA